MTDAERQRVHGRLRPMDDHPLAGSAPNCTPRAARNRIWTAIATASFWLVMAVLCFIRFGSFLHG